LIAAPPPAPPAIVREAELRTVIVWGDEAALDGLRRKIERRGWLWATGFLGESNPALFLTPPPAVSRTDILKLVDEINAGAFGKVNAGYGIVGEPGAQALKPSDG
jgi:hypothetical protein